MCEIWNSWLGALLKLVEVARIMSTELCGNKTKTHRAMALDGRTQCDSSKVFRMRSPVTHPHQGNMETSE